MLVSVTPITLRTAFPADTIPVKTPLALRFVWPVETAIPDAPEVQHKKKKIPKPQGELSRLSRGGYSLEKALGWEKSLYLQVQVHSINIYDAEKHCLTRNCRKMSTN
ncbi:MAG: hypothetical protein QOE33_3626 [Acidobacteriota bacterium]|jgi:hypothetical protein|nr:hypothetical protein [Acidobacteriota bacterium]